jgi:hypothetical protein
MLREGVVGSGEDQHGDRTVGAKHTEEAGVRRRMTAAR